MKNWKVIDNDEDIRKHVEEVSDSNFQKITLFESNKIKSLIKKPISLKSEDASVVSEDASVVLPGTFYDDISIERLEKRYNDILVLDNSHQLNYDYKKAKKQEFISIVIVKDADDYFWINLLGYIFLAPVYYELEESIIVKCDQLKGVIDFFEENYEIIFAPELKHGERNLSGSLK